MECSTKLHPPEFPTNVWSRWLVYPGCLLQVVNKCHFFMITTRQSYSSENSVSDNI